MLFAEVRPEAKEDLLEALKQSSSSKWYRRLKIIQLSSQQTPVPELVTFFDLWATTVRDYITRDNADGLAGLQPQASQGAPTKIPLSQSEWEELLHQSPFQYDRLQTGARNWNQELVVDSLRLDHGVSVTQSAVSRGLKQPTIAWNRGKLKVTSPDPLYTVKRNRIDPFKKKRLPAP